MTRKYSIEKLNKPATSTVIPARRIRRSSAGNEYTIMVVPSATMRKSEGCENHGSKAAPVIAAAGTRPRFPGENERIDSARSSAVAKASLEYCLTSFE